MNTYTVSSILIVLAGFMAMMYRGYAEKYGWAIGSVWYKKESLIGFLVWLAIIPGIIQLIHELNFIKGIGIGAALFFTAPIVLYVFKTHSQYLIYLMIPASLLIWIIGGVETVTI